MDTDQKLIKKKGVNAGKPPPTVRAGMGRCSLCPPRDPFQRAVM